MPNDRLFQNMSFKYCMDTQIIMFFLFLISGTFHLLLCKTTMNIIHIVLFSLNFRGIVLSIASYAIELDSNSRNYPLKKSIISIFKRLNTIIFIKIDHINVLRSVPETSVNIFLILIVRSKTILYLTSNPIFIFMS